MRKEKIAELERLMSEVRPVSYFLMDDKSKFVDVSVYNILLNNGKTIRREKITKNGKDGSAVIIFALDSNNEVLLSVEPRVFTKNGVGVSLPAGYIEDGESPIVAAIRELLEETGYLASNGEVIAEYYQDEGISSAYNYGVLLTDLVDTGKQHLDEDEFVKKFKCSVDEVLELIDMSFIESVNSKYTVQKAVEKIKIMKK